MVRQCAWVCLVAAILCIAPLTAVAGESGPAVAASSGVPLPEWAQEPHRLVRNWFCSLVASGSEDAWRAIATAFPIGEEGHARFRERVARNFGIVGAPQSFDLVNVRSLSGTEGWVQLVYLMYNQRLPLAWEFTWYRPRPDKAWQLNLVRMESDAIYPFVSLSQLEFESISPAAPAPGGSR